MVLQAKRLTLESPIFFWHVSLPLMPMETSHAAAGDSGSLHRQEDSLKPWSDVPACTHLLGPPGPSNSLVTQVRSQLSCWGYCSQTSIPATPIPSPGILPAPGQYGWKIKAEQAPLPAIFPAGVLAAPSMQGGDQRAWAEHQTRYSSSALLFALGRSCTPRSPHPGTLREEGTGAPCSLRGCGISALHHLLFPISS